MTTFEAILRSHPRADQPKAEIYAQAIEAVATCIATCTGCADACLAETEHLEKLRHCIRTDQDCADVCTAVLRVLVRQTETTGDLVHAQLHACVVACQICADECERHAEMHEHCRVCAETCRHCQERCNFLLGEISSSPTAEGFNPEESPSMS